MVCEITGKKEIPRTGPQTSRAHPRPQMWKLPSQARMLWSKHLLSLASWVPPDLLIEITLVRLSLSILRKNNLFRLLQQQIANLIGNQIVWHSPSVGTSLPSAVKLIDTIPNGKKYGSLNRKGKHLTVDSKYMRGENIWINIPLLNIYWNKQRY